MELISSNAIYESHMADRLNGVCYNLLFQVLGPVQGQARRCCIIGKRVILPFYI